MNRARFRATIVVGLVFTLLLATTGIASAGLVWIDPPIPGTPLHLWFAPDEEGGSEYRIQTREVRGAVLFRTRVRNEECEGSFEAGINLSDEAPGDWLMHEVAECGDKIDFRGVWYDGQLYTEDEFKALHADQRNDHGHDGDSEHDD